MAGSSRLVIRRVFEGGEGVIRGGRSERSKDSGVLGVDEPDRLLAMVGELPVFRGGSFCSCGSIVSFGSVLVCE